MAEQKTRPDDSDVRAYLQGIEDENKRQDSFTVLEMMRSATGVEPKLWGGSMVGFGNEHYVYESGREGDTFKIGFSPRKQALTIYLTYGFEGQEGLMQRLGKYKTGKACLYVRRLSDIDLDVLDQLIRWALQQKTSA